MQFARAAEEDAEIIQELKAVVLVKVHNQRGIDAGLIQTYHVSGYPSFVLENYQGETLYRWWGYSREAFLKEIRNGLADPTTIDEKIARYEKNPDLATARALASYHFSIREVEKVVAYYTDAAAFDPDNDYAYELYNAYRRGFGRPYTEEDIITATNKALASEYVNVEKKLRIYDQMCDAVIRLPGNPHILNYIKEGQAYAKDKTDENLHSYKERINIAYVLYIDKDVRKAVALKKNTFNDGWMDNARQLNAFSWWCFEHQINLQEAEKLARRGVLLAEPGAQKASILDTQAEIVFLQGDTEQALALIKEAIKENPEREYFQTQLTRFEKAVASNFNQEKYSDFSAADLKPLTDPDKDHLFSFRLKRRDRRLIFFIALIFLPAFIQSEQEIN